MARRLTAEEMRQQLVARRNELSLGSPEESRNLLLAHSRPPKGTRVQIALDRIRRSPYQPRLAFPFDELEALAVLVKESGGLRQPIEVRPLPGDSSLYELLDGERRLQTFEKVLGWPEIDAVVDYDCDDVEAAKKVALANLGRVDLCDFELARAARTLLETGAASSGHACARMMSIDQKALRNLLKFFDLPPAALAELEQTPRAVSATFVPELVDAANDGKADLVVEAIRLAGQGKIKGKGLLTYIANHAAKKSRAARQLQGPSGGKMGSITVGTNTVTLKLDKGIDTEKVAAAVEKLLRETDGLKKEN